MAALTLNIDDVLVIVDINDRVKRNAAAPWVFTIDDSLVVTDTVIAPNKLARVDDTLTIADEIWAQRDTPLPGAEVFTPVDTTLDSDVPEEGSVTEGLLRAFAPWMTADLDTYLRAIGGMFTPTEIYSLSDWTILLDPDLCPAEALPYLAQFVGERLPAGITEDAARQWIKDAPNQVRGTIGSIVSAAGRYLTGTKIVAVIERDTGADRITVVTYIDQTPDPAKVLTELKTVVPADIVLTYNGKATGQTWSTVKLNYATWTLAKAHYPTWADVKADRVGGTYVG